MMSLLPSVSRKRRFALSLPSPNLMPDLAEYMTTKEAADELEITPDGVRRLVRISKLESVSVGRIYLVSRKSVRDYLEKTQGKGKNDPTRGKKQD